MNNNLRLVVNNINDKKLEDKHFFEKDELKIIPVSSIDEVISNALETMPEKIEMLDISSLPSANNTSVNEKNIAH